MAEKTCPWCAEQVREEARKCRYCGSRLESGLSDPRDWHRGYADRKLAGVCAAVAHNLGVSITAVRVGFLLLALFHGLGIALYAILWFLLPDAPGGRSAADRLADALNTLVGRGGSGGPHGDAPKPPEERREGASGGEASGGWTPTRS